MNHNYNNTHNNNGSNNNNAHNTNNATKDYPSPPEPKWDYNQCKQHNVCMHWMKTGTCLVEGCKFAHEIPSGTEEGTAKCHAVRTLDMIVNPSMWRHLNEVNSEQFITENNLVLMDSGSNEVVRPYNGW